MGTNTTVLIVVAAMAALVLACVLAGEVYKTRIPKRGEAIRDQADEDSLRLRRQDMLADEYAARAHSARVEIDIKTIRARHLEELATLQRSETAAARDHLSEQSDRADKFNAQAQTRELRQPVGLTLFVGVHRPATRFAAPLSGQPLG
jgi:hypothetical protein